LGDKSQNHSNGQRLATLSMKLMVVYALMRFDITMVDGQGKKINR
jgi:hypothetical protein